MHPAEAYNRIAAWMNAQVSSTGQRERWAWSTGRDGIEVMTTPDLPHGVVFVASIYRTDAHDSHYGAAETPNEAIIALANELARAE